MTDPYHCPNCKTNHTRFNLIEQHAKVVKLDASTGDIVLEYSSETIEPFHMQYKGPPYKVQCGVCGLLEDETMFIKYATYSNKKEHVSWVENQKDRNNRKNQNCQKARSNLMENH